MARLLILVAFVSSPFAVDSGERSQPLVSSPVLLADVTPLPPAGSGQLLPAKPEREVAPPSLQPTTVSAPGSSREAETAQSPMSPLRVVWLTTLVLGALGVTVLGGLTLWRMWYVPGAHRRRELSPEGRSADPGSFSLIVPARYETTGLHETLESLAALDHPDYEVVVVVGHDDLRTLEVAHAAALRHPQRIVVAEDSRLPRSKPRALNTALSRCRGEYIGVVDAQTELHARLLSSVAAQFAATNSDVVAVPVTVSASRHSWWALRPALESYVWFRSGLERHIRAGSLPLGGNATFFRSCVLRSIGGWNENSLAEGAELGVRLVAADAVGTVMTSQEVVARQEGPLSLTSLLNQRTRVVQGGLQIAATGVVAPPLPSLPAPHRSTRLSIFARAHIGYTSLEPLLGAVGIPAAVALALTGLFTDVPDPVALICLLPLLAAGMALALEMVALGECARSLGKRVRLPDYVVLIAGALPYHFLLAWAATRGVLRQLRGRATWLRVRVGTHRRPHRATPRHAAMPGTRR